MEKLRKFKNISKGKIRIRGEVQGIDAKEVSHGETVEFNSNIEYYQTNLAELLQAGLIAEIFEGSKEVKKVNTNESKGTDENVDINVKRELKKLRSEYQKLSKDDKKDEKGKELKSKMQELASKLKD